MPSDRDLSFFAIATSRSVVLRAMRIAGVVGIVLAAINHADTVLSGQATATTVPKIVVTFLVPYCVSTYSSVGAVREKLQSLEN